MTTKGKFPNGLARLMDAKDIGPTALAREIEDKQQNISRWRDAEQRIPLDRARKLAGYFGVSVAEVMLPEGSSNNVPEAIRKKFESLPDSLTDEEVRFLADALDLILERHKAHNSGTRDTEPQPVG